MGDLDVSACKEWFSVAYVEALAYAGGFAVTTVRVDHFGVDLEIRDSSLRIDVQMKCTQEDLKPKSMISWDLDARTYNLLADPARNVPAYLFVVEVPKERTAWATIRNDHLRMHRLGYYKSMKGLSLTANSSSRVVKLPRVNVLSVSALEKIMWEARNGI